MDSRQGLGTFALQRVSAFLPLAAAALLTSLLVYRFDVLFLVAALFGLAGLAAMLALPQLATLAVLFVLYTNLAVVAIRFHGVPNLLGFSFFLLLAIPLFRYTAVDRQRLIFNATWALLLLHSMVLVASSFLSDDTAASLHRVGIFAAEGIVLYFLVLNTVRSQALLRKALWTLVAAGGLMGSLSLYQGATHSYSTTFGGLAQMQQRDEDWDADNRPRLAGPIGEKNFYAQIMLALLPLALALFLLERQRALRAAALLACVPILAGMMLTLSRGAFVALVGLSFLMVMVRWAKLTHVVAAGLLLGAVLLIAMPRYAERLANLGGLSALKSGRARQTDAALRGRATENLAAVRIFLDHPLLGVGPGQAPMHTAQYGNAGGFKRLTTGRMTHNLYLASLAETGLIGFLTFSAIIGVSLRRLWLARRHVRPESAIGRMATGLFLALAVYLICGFFLDLAFERYFWLLLALAGAAVHISRTPAPAAQPAR